MHESIFLTGFPGFIAGRLLRHLLPATGRFFLLVQPALAQRAKEEIGQLARENGRAVSDFQIIEGDIARPDLGMTSRDLEIARSDTTAIFHLAAIYDLAVDQDLAMRVNVEGTRNVNAFARSLSHLRHYHYVSTCYVAGKRKGLIRETELRHDAGFRNHYEETKYLAELEVEALKGELPITIHRPAVVCGDSTTGQTAKYDGVYYLIRYLLKWPVGLSLLNIGNHDVTLNLVPVDFVVESITALAGDRGALGKTVQLADPNPFTTHEIFDAIARSLTGHGSRLTVPPGLVRSSLMLPTSPLLTGLPHHAVPYFFLKQTYDSQQARALLEPHNVTCPPFSSYVDKIVEFAARHPQL